VFALAQLAGTRFGAEIWRTVASSRHHGGASAL